jgi:hypothetical protein
MPQDPWNDNATFGARRNPGWEQLDEHGNVVADSDFPNGFPDTECVDCGEPLVAVECAKDPNNDDICNDCLEARKEDQ